jgi:hypothetical protein
MLAAAPAAQVADKPRMGGCPEKNQPGGCKLHNLQCGYPKCDELTEAAAAPAVVVDSDMIERARDAYRSVKRYSTGDYPEGSIRSGDDLHRNDSNAWESALAAALSQGKANG